MNIQSFSLNSNVLSLGSLLGSAGSPDLIAEINRRCGGGSFFATAADPFRTGFEAFMNTVIEPIRNVQMTLANTAQQLVNADVYRPITSEKELEKGIPPCMQLGVIYTPAIRQMLDEERIDGFGIDPKTLQEGDPYGDVLNSGTVWVHTSNFDGKDLEITWHESNIDPELSAEEWQALGQTREFLENFIMDKDTKAYDPTDYPNLHC